VSNFPTRRRIRQGKVQFQSYLYQRKILLRVETSDPERHELYCTHCFDTPVQGPATHNLPGFWRIKRTRMTNSCMHDHMKLVHPGLPRSYEQEEVRFASLGQTVTTAASLKRRYPDDEEPKDDGEEHFRTRSSGVLISKRIFRRLLAQSESLLREWSTCRIVLEYDSNRFVPNTTFGKAVRYSWAATRRFSTPSFTPSG
jgi:hypothetical protein